MYCVERRQSRGGGSTVAGAINKARRRRSLLTTPSYDRLAVTKFSKSRVWDTVCPLKTYQRLHETQLPQSECAQLCIMTNGRTCRPSKLRVVSVRQVDVRAARRPSEVRSINLARPYRRPSTSFMDNNGRRPTCRG